MTELDKKIADTLSSFKNVKQEKIDPMFHLKVLTEINRRKNDYKIKPLIYCLSIAASILLIFNVFTLIESKKTFNQQETSYAAELLSNSLLIE